MLEKERWRKLCEQAVVEQDSTKLMKLIHEINLLLKDQEEEISPTESEYPTSK